MALRRAAYAPLIALTVLITGCAATERSVAPASRQSAPAIRYNLTGYSPAFKQGYADACASPRRRSEQRFKSDADYKMGWNDGNFLCSRTKN